MLTDCNYHTKIMGCDFDMTFIENTIEAADKNFIQAMQIAQEYEKQFSRFDEQSELSKINRKTLNRVSNEFLSVYKIAYKLYKKTNAIFNPLVQVARTGYNKSFDKLTSDTIVDCSGVKYNTDMSSLNIAQNKIILQSTQKLDFGGFLKGYVAQEISKKIKTKNGIIINIGGDMYVRGKNEKNQPFIVEIAYPDDENKNITIPLQDKSLCTSGVYRRKWRTGSDTEKHHILSSKTRDSAKTDILSASVVNKDGAVADAYATLAVAEGAKKAVKFFKKQNVEFVIICKNGDIIISDNLKKTIKK